MRAEVVTRCEITMSRDEIEMLNNVAMWIDYMQANGEVDEMPEGIQEILKEIHDDVMHLLSQCPTAV